MKHANWLLALAFTACGTAGQDDDDSGGTTTTPAKNYQIDLVVAHSHIYRKVAQLFTVYDLDSCTNPADHTTCAKVPGLTVKGFYRTPGDAPVVEQALEVGKLEDNADGTYTFYVQFGALGSHVIGLKILDGDRTYFTAFPFTTSQGGGEKFFCDTNADSAPDVVHMVRWSASKGSITADGTEIAFAVEIKHSINTPINTTQSYNNTFDHLRPQDFTMAPAFRLMRDTGASATPVATLTATYKGMGVYEVKHAFASAEMGGAMDRTFWLDVMYTDADGCEVSSMTDEENYHFPVMDQM